MNLTSAGEDLIRRDAEWSRLASDGRDIERILSYWTEDAVLVPPGLPTIVGRAALRKYVEDSLQIPGFNINWESHEVRLSPDEQLGYMFSRNWVTLNDPDGTPVTTEGRAVTIWLREADGEWRCAVDIWNA